MELKKDEKEEIVRTLTPLISEKKKQVSHIITKYYEIYGEGLEVIADPDWSDIEQKLLSDNLQEVNEAVEDFASQEIAAFYKYGNGNRRVVWYHRAEIDGDSTNHLSETQKLGGEAFVQWTYQRNQLAELERLFNDD